MATTTPLPLPGPPEAVPAPVRLPGRVRFLRAPFQAGSWHRALYALLSFPIAVTVPIGLGVLLGAPWSAVGLGVAVVLLLTVACAGLLARVERARIRSFLDIPLADPPVRSRGREIAHALLSLPLGLIVSAGCAQLLVYELYWLTWPVVFGFTVDPTHGEWGGPSRLGVIAVHFLPGIPMLFLLPWIVRGLTWLQVRLARALLGPAR